ncbi:hypothetical protein IWX49DRAFT_421788 [Phyllosticta citricarpa]|uniref:Uncharacterized protein n=1 Tax=Phyllosticta paracitricarpa TaxID=2016321 RepID=A0ABR1N8M3_9PEZI
MDARCGRFMVYCILAVNELLRQCWIGWFEKVDVVGEQAWIDSRFTPWCLFCVVASWVADNTITKNYRERRETPVLPTRWALLSTVAVTVAVAVALVHHSTCLILPSVVLPSINPPTHQSVCPSVRHSTRPPSPPQRARPCRRTRRPNTSAEPGTAARTQQPFCAVGNPVIRESSRPPQQHQSPICDISKPNCGKRRGQ